MLKKLSLGLFFFWIGAFASPQITHDYEKGRDLAAGHNFPLTLIFTGSDWSESSKELIQEILDSPFTEAIFVQVDFPELNTQSASILSQNAELKEKYCIESFPTVVLLNSNEEEIARMGFPISGVDDFGDHLKQAFRRYSLLERRFEEAKKSKSIGELKVCYLEARSMGAQILAEEVLSEGKDLVPELMMQRYIATRNTPEGKVLKKKIEGLKKKEIASQLALLAFQDGEGVESIERYLEEYESSSKDHLWKMHLVLSEFLEEKDQALKHAKVSYEHAPESEKSNIQRIISRMLPSESPSEFQKESEKECN